MMVYWRRGRAVVWDVRLYFRDRLALRAWLKQGRTGLTPHLAKQQTVLEYGQRFGLKILIETGTYHGYMVRATQAHFEKLYSIELDPTLAARAKGAFARQPHIQILQGDSAQQLPGILAQLQQPGLFWLDAHYSGGITAQGPLDTPIQQELELILRHPVAGHVILIDDAREFVGQHDYPTVEQLQQLVGRRQPAARMDVREDIIRITSLTGRS